MTLRLSLRISIVFLLATCAVSRATATEIANAEHEFSTVSNPNNNNPLGSWTFGYTDSLGGTFVPYDHYFVTSNGRQSWNSTSPDVAAAGTAVIKFTQEVGNIQPGWLTQSASWFLPGEASHTAYSVIRFTASAVGTYDISSPWQPGIMVSGSNTITLLHNGAVLGSDISTLSPPPSALSAAGVQTSFSSTGSTLSATGVSLSVNDTVDLLVGSTIGFNFDLVRTNLILSTADGPPPPGPYLWTSAAGDARFDTAANWSGNSVPSATDEIQFGVGSNYVSLPSGGADVDRITLRPAAYPVSFNAFGTHTPLTTNALAMSDFGSLSLNNTDLKVYDSVSIANNAAISIDQNSKLEVIGTTSLGSGSQLTVHGGSYQAVDGTEVGDGNAFGTATAVFDLGATGYFGVTNYIGRGIGLNTTGHLTLKEGSHLTANGTIHIGDATSANGNTLTVQDAGTSLTPAGPLMNIFVGNDENSGNILEVKNGGLVDLGTGDTEVATGGSVSLEGGTLLTGTLLANGPVSVNGGTLTTGALSGSSSVRLASINTNFQITGSADVTLGDNQLVRGASAQGVVVGQNSHLTVNGAMVVKSTSGITLRVTSGGVMKANSLEIDGGEMAVTSTGLLDLPAAASILVHQDDNAIGGILSISGSTTFTNGKHIDVGNGGLLFIDSSTTLGGNVGESLTVENGGTLAADNFIVNNNGVLDLKNGSEWSNYSHFSGPRSIAVNLGGQFKTGNAKFTVSGELLLDVNGGKFTAADTTTTAFQTGTDVGSTTIRFHDHATGSFGSQLHVGDADNFDAYGAIVEVSSGSQFTTGSIVVGNITSGDSSIGGTSLTLTGSGTQLTPLPATSGMPINVGSQFKFGVGDVILTILDGALVDAGTASTTLGKFGSLLLDGGTLRTSRVILSGGGGDFNFASGTLALTRATGYSVSLSGELGVNPTLTAGKTLEVVNATTIPSGQTLTIDGGTLNTGSLVFAGGTLDFTSGTLGITGAGGLTVGSTGPFGSALGVAAGQIISVTNTATINQGASLTMNGGQLSASTITNSGTLTMNAGIFAAGAGGFTNTVLGKVFVASGASVAIDGQANNNLGGRITLGGNYAQLAGTGVLNNSGVILGDGQIVKPLANAATGEVRIIANQSIILSGATTNGGRINNLGGTLEVDQQFVNSSAGAVTGHGLFFFHSGVTSAGQFQLSAGSSDFYGDVSLTGGNNGNSKLLIGSGNNVVTIYGNLVHNGAAVNTGDGSKLIVFGEASGAGSFTGPGPIFFEGGYSPGNSPAATSFEGDLYLGANSSLTMELAGSTPGTQHDQLNVGGSLFASGTMNVELLGDFTPVSGQVFDLLDWGSLAGQFSSISLPALAGGLNWNTSQLYTKGIISVGTPGDFSGDEFNNAADYVVARKRGGVDGQANLDAWRSNFGASAVGSGGASAVPEPSVVALLAICAFTVALVHRQSL